MNDKYFIVNSDSRNGWCIFARFDGISMVFVAGAFESKERAQSECFRLKTRGLNDGFTEC